MSEIRRIGPSTWERRTEDGVEYIGGIDPIDADTFTITLDKAWFPYLQVEELIAIQGLVCISREELHRLREIEWQYNQLCK